MTGMIAKLMEPMIDEITNRQGMWFLIEVSATILVVFVLRGAATYGHTVLMNRIGQRIITDVQQDLFRHLLTADLTFFHSHASGTLLSRLTNDVGVMRSAVGECMTSTFKSGLTLLFLVGLMFYQDWRLAIGACLVFPPSAYMVAKVGKRMRRLSANTQTEIGNFASFLSQVFQGIRHVKAYGMEGKESGQMKRVTENIFKMFVKGYHISALTNPISELLAGIAIVTVVLYGGSQVLSGQSTPGALFSFIAAFLLAYDPIKRMAKMNAQLQAGLAAAERVFELFDTRPSITNSPEAKPLVTDVYPVALKDVTFSYPDGTTALRHVTISVPHGQTVAIVGASGSGKSTIINLICRFYDVQQGEITIAGQNIRGITLESLRSKLALVSQEIVLFDDTVRANIAYGKEGATEAEIEAAAQSAFADQFIRALPQGYDTVIGEHGVKLSGGQRQRISIARAMLRDAPILLLDEATSALDTDSERAVQSALRELQQGRTTIVVAHRLSTIVDANHIIVLEAGKVTEQGTHADLLARGGTYARLYGVQGHVNEVVV